MYCTMLRRENKRITIRPIDLFLGMNSVVQRNDPILKITLSVKHYTTSKSSSSLATPTAYVSQADAQSAQRIAKPVQISRPIGSLSTNSFVVIALEYRKVL